MIHSSGATAPVIRPDDVDQPPLRVVHLQLHVDPRRTGTDVVRRRQRSPPGFRRDRALQPLQQLDAVAIRHRLNRNRREGFDLVDGNPLDTALRRTARRGRIAGIARHVHHAAALNHAPAAERTFGIHVALGVAVLVWIRVDDAGDGAVLGRHLRLDPAPAAAIAREHDLPFHVDAELLERLVVGRHAKVHVDNFAGDIAGWRIGVVRGKNSRLVGPLVAANLLFLDIELHLIRRDDVDAALPGPGQQHAVFVFFRLDAERLELRDDVIGELDLVRRPGVMRLRGHDVEIGLRRLRGRRRLQFPLALELSGARRHGEAPDPIGVRSRRLCRQPDHPDRGNADRDHANARMTHFGPSP